MTLQQDNVRIETRVNQNAKLLVIIHMKINVHNVTINKNFGMVHNVQIELLLNLNFFAQVVNMNF